ncbi:dihydrolipoamide acetyltransferase family protein [Solimonas variicoloris]|uniref:dihydrolipoamide acetyltransferase family protein n=1 Tax=Solimonas variicoloris TaxID=254408 RepID=UPI0003800134|nr:dihydrolipoamide acetyltransferase family protein [Solimonas variicoloris]
MARYVFKLPDVGEGIAESEIATWRVQVGERVVEDQPLVDMLTDKAAVEIPSPVAGIVIERCGAEGDKIAVGAPLLVLETAADAAAGDEAAIDAGDTTAPAAPAAAPNVAPTAPTLAAGATLSATRGKPQTSPSVRKRSRELGIDLECVPGSGPRGRITHDDLAAYAGRATAPATARASGAPVDTVETIKVIGLRRKIAEAMQRAKQRIPHFAYVEEVDVTELEALRQHLNGRHGATRAKLTLLPFLMRALVQVRGEFPQINATYDDEQNLVHRHTASHVGVATQTPGGLVVPVVRHAETLDLWQAAAEIRRLADAARDGKAKREELSGSTITITSLGAMGGIVSTPVINAPEVAIVGVNKMVERPMIRNGAVVPRLMMNLSSSFDHRIVDGWDAAAFIQAIKSRLEHPATLFVD